MKSLLPLPRKINRALFGITFLAFLATALITGRNEYANRHAELGRIMQAQARMAQSLIHAQVLRHEKRIESIIDDLLQKDPTVLLSELQDRLRLYDPFDSYFVLDKANRVAAVSAGHEYFLGLDFSGLDTVRPHGKISPVYQSLITKRTVVGINYPIQDGLRLVYERDIENILPVLRYIETESLIPEESLFVLSAEGIVVNHADRALVQSRHNLAFDLKKMRGPDAFLLASYSYQGRKYHALVSELEIPAGWTVYFQFPSGQLNQATNRAILGQLLNILLFFVFIAFMLHYTLNRFFSLPVGNLMQALGKYTPGEEEPIVDLAGSGIVEFYEIGRAINKMAEDVAEFNRLARQGEERIKLLLNSTAEAIYGLDRQGRCIFCNAAFLKILRFSSEEELLGKNVHNLIHHSHPNGSACPSDKCIAHQGILQGRLTQSDEEVFYRADGSSFPAECWSHPLIVEGKIEGAVVTFIDISQRKEAQAALLESEYRYRTLVENIDLGIALIDADHKVVMANTGHGKILGRDPECFIGKHCFREFENRDRICDHCPGVKAISSGRAEEVITSGVRADGEKFYVRARAFPLGGKAGTMSGGFIEVVEDITERLQTEEKLAAETERLAVTLRSIGDGVITSDTEGNVLLINKVAENLTGWTQEEALGRPLPEIFRIINEYTREPCENPVDKVLSTGKIIGLANHTTLISKDGRERSIADSGAPIRDKDSNVIGVVLVFRDVTEQLRLEQELQKTKKLESIGVLAGGIAHDFNNILVAVLGNLSLASSLVQPEHRLYPLLKDAEKASLRAQDLTLQLLTFSKGGEPVKEAASLTEIIKDSARFILHGQKAACRFDLPEDLWLVNMDKGQMSQVIQNIILNASQAMPEGGSITISCRNVEQIQPEHPLSPTDEKYVRITIEDTGPGIPPKVVDKIFDPYFSTKKEGSGLGLAITHSIVDKHNGHISVQSPPGRGAAFTILLPASSVSPALIEEQSSPAAARKAKILVMDDDAMVQEVARSMLSFLGHEAAMASEGQEAIDLFRQEFEAGRPFDLLIMDLTIPGGMGGKQAVQEVLRIDPKAKVVVSSGYSTDPIMANYRQYGFAATITKPYLLETLKKVIAQQLVGSD